MKQCSTFGCWHPVFSKGLCQTHWRQQYGKPIKKSKTLKQTDEDPAKPFKVYRTAEIKKVSTRQQKLLAEYSILHKQFMANHPECEAKAEGCDGKATQVHHKKGRGEYLNRTETWLAVCFNCHRMIEENPEWAKQKGFSLSRLETKTI